jgi:predicted mannosyl-3-phosphoglycerate phosphatase (HAD superfamily)
MYGAQDRRQQPLAVSSQAWSSRVGVAPLVELRDEALLVDPYNHEPVRRCPTIPERISKVV